MVKCDATAVRKAQAEKERVEALIRDDMLKTETDVNKREATWKSKLQGIRNLSQLTENTALKAALFSVGILNNVVSAIRAGLSMAGIQLDAVTEAIINSILATASAAMSLAAIWYSNPYTMAIGFVITAVTLATSIYAQQQAVYAQQQGQALVANARNFVDSVGSSIITGIRY